MKFYSLKLLLFFFVISTGFAQQNETPQDFLKKEFHAERREQLRAKLPKNSVVVFFANPVRNRANDVQYVYHQDPNFFYLTGYKEPNALIFIFKENQTLSLIHI